jgi:hypothetical protein
MPNPFTALAGCVIATPLLGQPCVSEFTSHPLTAEASLAYSINAADMDDDGHVDILLPGSESLMLWLLNEGQPDPTFETRLLSDCDQYGDFSSAVADVDGDGDLDVVSVSADMGHLLWYESVRGQVVEFCTRPIPASGESLIGCAAADLDGDGDTDIVGSDEATGTLDWYQNDGRRTPTFDRRTIGPRPGTVHYVRCADADSDGDTDFLVVTGSHLLSLYTSDGAADPLFTPTELGGGFIQAALADLDGDGDGDVAATRAGGAVVWLENLGGQPPAFAPHALASDPREPWPVAVADMDLDGRPDIVAATRNTGDLWLFHNDGGSPPTFRWCEPGAAGAGIQEIDIADLDGDGDPDVAAREPAGSASWFENTPCLADFNRDQVVDTRDVLAFLNAWLAGDSRADFDGNGVNDSRDVLAFLNLWVADCD